MKVNRRHVLGVLVALAMAFLLSLFALITSPAWLTILLIRPSMADKMATTSVKSAMSHGMRMAMKTGSRK